MKESGLKHVTFSTADGALEAAPAVRDSVYLLEFVHLNFLMIKHVSFCLMTRFLFDTPSMLGLWMLLLAIHAY